MSKWWGIFVVAGAFALGAAGCSGPAAGPSLPTPAGETAVAGATSTTPPKPYLTSTPTLELNDRTTKPGTKIKFGEQAVVPFNSMYEKGLLGITITVDSAPAPDADIDNLPLKDEDKAKLRGKMFFFVRVKMVDMDGANFKEIFPPTLFPRTRSGGFPGVLIGGASTDVTGCESESMAPSDFSTPGAVFEQCELFFGTSSDPIVAVAYAQKPYEDTSSREVTWRK
ncbi:hypothetical protein [Amycolatopsis sp. GM8]|uniref:hypothetical protein n=1 Tax=Amycolatopsis sp. GM8 TaxID=2896530 RepID=UPI001F21C965|nr:hypothetical protein [Amycolatopsis sp. GM8]